MKEKLAKLIGQEVRLSKGDDCSNKFHLRCVGKLEHDPEDGSYYVRISEGFHGTNGIGFNFYDIESVDKEVYLWHIALLG